MTLRKQRFPGSEQVKVIPNPERKQTQFQFVNKGFPETLLLVPGWGLDYRIFAALDLRYNYLVSTLVWPADFVSRLEEMLQKSALERISILGHSMGGFLASDFAAKYPDKISELILVGVRKRYGAGEISPIRKSIKEHSAGFMYKIYDLAFSPSEKDLLSHFKSTLLKIYIKELDRTLLNAGLDYLSAAEITAKNLERFHVRFMHGDADAIAPISEAQALASELPDARFDRVKGGGHMLVLRKDFNSIFYGDEIGQKDGRQ